MQKQKVRVVMLGGLGILAGALGAANAAEELPRLGVTLTATSSQEAYMAGQIEVAHSKDIVGARIVAGGPFACAETDPRRLFRYWPKPLGPHNLHTQADGRGERSTG